MVQKSAKEEEIKDKGGKYHIYIPVYMELHIWGQMQYLLSLPLISSSFVFFFCTLLALSKFAENQIFRAVACAPTRTLLIYNFFFGLLQYCICLSLYWHMFILGTETSNQHAIISSHYTFRCWKVADIASYSLVLVQFPRFFYHHPSPLRVTLQRKLMKLRP